MELNIKPSNMATVTLRKTAKGNSYVGNISIPPHILERNNLENKEKIVIAFICKEEEDLPNK
jgi:hypothetical protein